VGVLQGRDGHARIVLLTVIDSKFEAIRDTLGAKVEAPYTGLFAPFEPENEVAPYCPFVVAKCVDRTNAPAAQRDSKLLERFRSGIMLLVGTAGGARLEEAWPGLRSQP
jgi:hypothetical protein